MPAELTIDLDRDEPTTEHLPPRQRMRRRWPIQTAACAGAVVVIAGVALAAASAVGRPGPVPAAPQPPPPTVVVQQHPRLIAPATAAPGERIVVLAYRTSNMCGPAELRLDGEPLRQRILAYADRDPHPYHQLVISVDLPLSATPGAHRIDLLGPVQSDRGGICGDRPERQLRIDSTAISVTAMASD